MFSAQELASVLNQWGIYAVIGSIVVSVLVSIAGILPSVFVTGANIIVFGPYKGFFISWLGEVIGATLSFCLYRLGFKNKTEHFANKSGLLANLLTTEGKKAGFLIFQARVIPFIPSGIVTLAAAVSNISLNIFLIATALGKLPALVLETLISYDVIYIEKNFLRLITVLTALIISYLFYRITD